MEDLEHLMSELSWLKRLASALVRDESDANDLVQETWLVAAEHAPTDGRPLKPWLSRVALNLVRMRSRSSTRRRAREAAVPDTESPPAPDELVNRLRAQRIVADEVLRLAEPYRNTILLHYFEDLSSAEIARRTGTPEGTVRRRLKTALDELRGRLHAEERTTGQPVVAVLAPLAIKQGAASAALGAVVVKKILAVIVAAALVLVGAHYYKKHQASAPVAAGETQAESGMAKSRAIAHETIAHVTIAVVDRTGPVANAWVRCAPADGEVVVAKTGSDGSAVVDLAAGPWSIAASAEAHEPATTTLAVVAAKDARVQLLLAPGGQTLTGVVTDMTGGEIAGARIDAARVHLGAKTDGAIAVAFTDQQGRYKLAVGAGEILVAASHPDYAAQTRYLDIGAEGATASFALVPGGGIEGIVRDQITNEPVAGAAVHAISDSALELAEASERIVKADPTGKFRFSGLRPGAYELTAREGARSSRVPVGVGIGVAEQQTNIVVLVGPTATIRGNALDDTGAPAAGITVYALESTGADKAITDAAGAFVIEGLAPGRWVLRGESDTTIPDGQAIVPLNQKDVDGIVVRVRRGHEVRGRVEPREVCDVEIAKDELGDAIPKRATVTTTDAGTFQFAPYGTGPATLIARCANGDAGTLAIAVGTGDNIIAVKPGGSIEGRVVDTTGHPVAGVMINAQSSDAETTIENGAVTSGYRAMTSATGAFQLAGLGAATYGMSVLDAGRPMKKAKSTKVALADGQHATGVEVVIERPTGKIDGTVTGPDGAPLADAWVAIHQTAEDELAALHADDDSGPHRVWLKSGGSEGRDPPPTLTDGRGHFAFTGLLRGRYQVVADAQAGKLRGGAADVTTDATVAVHLAGVTSLRGTVHGSRGPTDLFSVVLTGPLTGPLGAAEGPRAFPPPTEPNNQSRSFTGGAFVFPRLEPGDYAIEVESVDGTGQAKVHVSSEQEASVDIALVANGTVTGRIVDKSGKPQSGIGVVLLPDQPPDQLRIVVHALPPTSGPNGRFQVDGAPGMRTLAVLGNMVTTKRGLAIAAGKTIDVGDLIVEEPQK